MELRDYFNFSFDVLVQSCEVIRRNPVLAVTRASNDVHVILTEKLRSHLESQDIPGES